MRRPVALVPLAQAALLASLLASLLAACRIPVQDAPASTLAVPSAWRDAAQPGRVGPAAPAAANERDWWRAFGDPALDALVGQALARNGDVRTAASRLQEYRARIRVAQAAGAPRLTVGLTPARGRAIGPLGAPVEATTLTGNVQAAYELDPFERLENATQAARFDLAAQEAAAGAVALAVAANTASGYLNLRGLDAQLALARATLASRAQSLALARRQFEVGYTSRLEVAQSEAEYRATAGVVPQLERAIAQQENALAVLLGASPGPVARGTELAGLRAPGIAPGLPSELLRRRPDVAQAERSVAALDASLAAARDQMLPSLRLTASVGAYAHDLPDLLGSGTTLWSVGGSILAPLFDAGRLRAQAEIAASLRDRAVFAYETAVRNAFAETENALAAVRFLGQQLEQAEARRVATQEALRVARNRYRNGYSSYLEELDAQRNAFSAETGALQLRASWLAAHVDLYRALDVANWVLDVAGMRADAVFELVDIAQFGLPLLDEPKPPALGQYTRAHTKAWAARIAEFDGYVFVTPEYNHGTSGALKNAIDFLYAEWNDKAAGFVAYGSVGGVRAVEQLRLVMGELKIADVRAQVGLSLFADFGADGKPNPAERHVEALDTMLDQLVAWSRALQPLRAPLAEAEDVAPHGRRVGSM